MKRKKQNKKLAKDSCPWKILGQNVEPVGGSQSPFI